ncbi:MAG: hypothetical protein GY847_12145 [Proteobacteria bacterium]|nr:hypothetical protein [Pseudomonadota bacterium]
MKRFITITTASVLLVGVLVFTSSTAAKFPVEHAISSLSELRDAYLNLESIHLRANFQISLYEDNAESVTVGTGTYELWHQDGQYRIHSFSERGLGLANDFEILFDGHMFYFFDRDLDLISYHTGDGTNLPTSLPNPLLLPFNFLDVAPPDCESCRLRLRDLGNREHWNRRTQGARIPAHSKSPTTINIPVGGTKSLSSDDFLIYFSIRGERLLPSKIERVDAAGRSIYLVEFHSYSGDAVSGVEVIVPNEIEFIAYDTARRNREGESMIAIRTIITTSSIQLNRSIDTSVFEMDLSRAGRIWDGDAEMFIHSP